MRLPTCLKTNLIKSKYANKTVPKLFKSSIKSDYKKNPTMN